MGRIVVEKAVKRPRGWVVKARYFTGEYLFIGKEDRCPVPNERTVWRDLVQDAASAAVFPRKRDAVAFAFRVAYTNPERTGGILVEKLP
jgi:hypothetical protein